MEVIDICRHLLDKFDKESNNTDLAKLKEYATAYIKNNADSSIKFYSLLKLANKRASLATSKLDFMYKFMDLLALINSSKTEEKKDGSSLEN